MDTVKKKRKVGVGSKLTPMKSTTREEINKMRIPGVPYLPPPPDPNMFKRGRYVYVYVMYRESKKMSPCSWNLLKYLYGDMFLRHPV